MTAPSASLPAAFVALLRRDLSIAYRQRGELLHPLMFFVIAGMVVFTSHRHLTLNAPPPQPLALERFR